MDTVEFTPYRPTRRASVLVSAAAGLLLGVCGTATIVATTTGDHTDRLATESVVAATPPSDVAAQTAATHARLRFADCSYLAEVRRIRHGMKPWSADAASEWLSQSRGVGAR